MDMNAAGSLNSAKRVQAPEAAAMRAITIAQDPAVRYGFWCDALMVVAKMSSHEGSKVSTEAVTGKKRSM